MTRLMTWFIELQNRFNELRLFKISTIYVLNQVDDLTSWHWDEKRVTTRWVIIQRSESSQSRLLDQICIFFNYFWISEFNWFRATIMFLKVCWVVNVYRLIRAGEGFLLEGEAGDHSAYWIFSTSITESNLRIFELFSKHCTRLDQGYNYASQSMWGSQRAEVDPGARRCWRLKNRAAKTLDILDLICWVKSASFPGIYESLHRPRPALQPLSAKVLRQRAFRRSSRWMIDWSEVSWPR